MLTTVASCGGSGAAKKAEAFSAAILEPSSLMPANYSEIYGAQVVSALFTPLVTFDIKTNQTELKVAESIESADNKVWKVKLKPGWKFHNGEAVTSRSFVDAWNFAVNKKSAQLNAYVFGEIKGYPDVVSGAQQTMSGLRVVDDQNFEITLVRPWSQFKQLLGYPAFSPLPSVAYQDPKGFEQKPIGNGPFAIEGIWQHDQQITLRRYDPYPDAKAKAKEVQFKIYQSFDTAYNDLLAGNLDVLPAVPTARITEAKSQLGDRFQESPSGRMEYLGFPLDSDKFKSAGVRRAISMAIDRAAITKAIFQGTRTPATGYVPPVVPGAPKDACGATCVHDASAAKAAFDEAGGIPGNTFTIGYNSDAPENKEWVEAAAGQISKDLGVNVQTKAYPKLAVLLGDLGSGKVDSAFRTAWTFYFPSPENYLKPLFTQNAGENFSGYKNDKFEALLRDGAAAPSPESANATYAEAEQVLLHDMPYVPLWYQGVMVGHSKRVSDVSVDSFRRLRVESVVAN
ncbi:peptide/nickel transport system substrate-binding protein/oligopeptide transport system substrate-binding protein [Streptosporangium album]|uniref:Peptide/nickel transport system substrate-binding protein/oligopeptide transport system substrate-binding protein n=1 Tax=Streptosporangium album TaxID=47479 RepID=A0A7W7W941_9ACTN|nr:ABC transporter substrate-binding protein [Streptosporangium album]MBB4937665.1 peptide/nickel transport system substrate-binding protein/oligopeptide transport system substrate-binding protein [Streptosporangium album]